MVLAVYSEDNDLEVMLEPWHVREPQRPPPPNCLWSIVGRRRSSSSCWLRSILYGEWGASILKISAWEFGFAHHIPQMLHQWVLVRGLLGWVKRQGIQKCVFVLELTPRSCSHGLKCGLWFCQTEKPAVNMQRNLWEICHLYHLQHEFSLQEILVT